VICLVLSAPALLPTVPAVLEAMGGQGSNRKRVVNMKEFKTLRSRSLQSALAEYHGTEIESINPSNHYLVAPDHWVCHTDSAPMAFNNSPV
jgi:hypothetical protein